MGVQNQNLRNRSGTPISRYDRGRDARLPPGGHLARPVPRQEVRTAVGMVWEHPGGDKKKPKQILQKVVSVAGVVDAAVQDPGEPKRRVQVKVNRHDDVLERELSHGRISEAAYRVGRVVQAVFERAGGVGASPMWLQGDRVDTALAHELAIVCKIEDARKVEAYMAAVEKAIGEMGAKFLRRILGENQTFSEVAGKLASEKRIAFVGERFRVYLEELAESWSAARGR
jgi:hypothetical protein